MTDISEEDAVLHLKRALGELDSGDAVPKPLAPVALPPPKAKAQKTAPAQTAPAQQNFNRGPMVGPSPLPGGGQSSYGAAPPAKVQTWAEIRLQQEQEQKIQQQQEAIQKELKKAQQSAMQQAKAAMQAQQQSAGVPGLRPPAQASGGGPSPPGLGGMPPLPPGMGPPGGAPPGMPPLPTGPAMAAAAPAAEKNSVAAQVAAAMGPGKSQAHIDIPQAKIGMVIGRNGATLGAVKTYAKAECFIEQNTPDEDKARITIVGTANQVEKCKQTVNALVDGTMSAATLFQLAGVPLPAGGAGEASASDRDRLGGNVSAPSHSMPAYPPPGGGLPPFAGALAGLPGMAMGAPGMPPGMLPGMSGMPGNIPGMPENQQMAQNLNDYYARWWATYAKDSNDPSKGGVGLPEGPAFDKDALAKLAAKASEPEPEAPPLPPEPSMPHPTQRGVPISSLPHMSDPGFSALPPAPDDRYHSGFSSRDYDDRDASHASMDYDSEGARQPAVSSTAGARRPVSMALKTTEPPKAKKDDDSVQKMLERLQGNEQQVRQAKKDAEEAPPAAPVRMQLNQMKRGNQASLSQMLEAGGPSAVFGREDTRTRADVEFEALLSRIPSVQSHDEVENLGREVLIRFPTFSPQQISELLQKVDSNPGLQQGDFQAELSRVLIPRLKEFNSSQFTTLTSTFASWSNDARGNKKKGRFSEFSKAFFLAASAEMTSRLMEYAPHEINCCLAAFVSVGFSEHKFFASVGRAALARHSSFAPVQLTALLAILSEMRLVHVDLFNASAQFLSMRAKELRPVDVIRVLRSFSKCSVHHHGMCRAIGDEVVLRIRMKTSNFKVEDLCEIAYSFCVLQFYHEDMFRVLFKELEKSPMISTDALIQLYECHLTLDAEQRDAYSRYRMDRDLEHALQDHYREHRKDERRCSEKQRNDVASVLKSLVDGSVHVNHRTSYGLLVDVAALRKRSSSDGFVHVDLDSTVTVVRSLDQDEASPTNIIIEGPVALRRRILAKHGLRLVTVRESEWRELDDSKDKRRHLRSLLSSLGDVLE